MRGNLFDYLYTMRKMKMTFQKLLRDLSLFWEKQGCVIHQGYDLEVGAGTFNPSTFLRCLGPEPYKAAYIEPSRRPTDGRYGTNPNRLQHYFQYQVILKPSPSDIQKVYLESLEAVGFDLTQHDIRFVHDDWESPTLGAWGLGWEVWIDGSEVSQITYFQCVGGVNLKPITGEITYGLERLSKYLQKVPSMFDLKWNDNVTYGDIYHQNEVEWSAYNFENASTEMWLRHFDDYEREARQLAEKNLPIPAYDFVIKASHAFNLLDARGAISVTERTGYIARIRELAKLIAESYMKSREEQGYPLNKKFATKASSVIQEEHSPHEQLKGTHDFLLEIGSEELPATFVPIGLTNLEKDIKQLLEKEIIPYKSLKTYGTPRRLAIVVEALESAVPEKTVEKRGPPLEQLYNPDGTPKPSAVGFFRSIGIDHPPTLPEIRSQQKKNLEIRVLKDVEYLFATVRTPAKLTQDILSQLLPKVILGLDFPKKMRWADLDLTYARPILWITALHGSQVIPFTVGNIQSGNSTLGHRQLAPSKIILKEAKEYQQELKKHFVMVDVAERKQSITSQLDALEKTLNARIIERERVIPQVINLVEWPQITAAQFDQNYLKAPKEVLISEMVEHQKYFPVVDSESNLKNFFVITANNTPSDKIREGNQIVLSARLSDGVFLYQQDLKTSLDQLNQKLKQVTFQKDLGSVYDKVERTKAHVRVINEKLLLADTEIAARAAELSKADLASAVVYEFPELQGIMGRYYALAQKEPKEVAQAIEEHWMPKGENAPLPDSPASVLVSLADKIDNLLGCFVVGLKPTSSSDPYALRRQVLGMIKMLIRGKYSLSLEDVLNRCCDHFKKIDTTKKAEILKEIKEFITSRVRTVFLDYGFNKDEIEASLAQGVDDIYDAFRRVEALHAFRKTDRFKKLYEVYKRAKGQLQGQASARFDANLLQEAAEKELDHALSHTEDAFKQSVEERHYEKAYHLIADLQVPLANLFEHVKVLADDPQLRQNRIALLNEVFGLFGKLLDFSKIQ